MLHTVLLLLPFTGMSTNQYLLIYSSCCMYGLRDFPTVNVWLCCNNFRHNHKEAVFNIGWTRDQRQCLTLAGKHGPIWLWHIQDSKNVSILKESQSFTSAITMFRWHHERASDVVIGHEDGSVSLLQVGEW